jgi:signal-transduction protein with cAMP-binding, CBS, and nucleotidyltransferase domain
MSYTLEDKQKIFLELPPKITYEVSKTMYGGIMSELTFFNGKDPTFIGLIVPLLSPLYVKSGEFVFKKGNHPNYIFFIIKGRVSFMIESKNICYKDMIEGCYFGEIDLINDRPRSFTVKATQNSELLTL